MSTKAEVEKTIVSITKKTRDMSSDDAEDIQRLCAALVDLSVVVINLNNSKAQDYNMRKAVSADEEDEARFSGALPISTDPTFN